MLMSILLCKNSKKKRKTEKKMFLFYFTKNQKSFTKAISIRLSTLYGEGFYISEIHQSFLT